MLHRLPPAKLVDRVEALGALARGRRVVHIGFVDQGFREMQERAGVWLHERLASEAAGIVGVDVDPEGVADAMANGYEAVVVDCCDVAAVRRAGIAPAPLVIAGEVIEHLDAPGHFLASMHELVAPGGQLVVTTPNAYGWLNVCASLLGREINHPDHVVMFTWRTLTALAARHGWEPVRTEVYVPAVKPLARAGLRDRVMTAGAQVVCAGERLAARLGRGYAADGLAVTFQRARDPR